MRDDYSYFADGRLKLFHDLDDTTAVQGQWHYMSRSYSYDQAARVAGVGPLDPNTNNTQPPPFSASYGYDPFGNMTSRAGSYGVHTWQGDGAPYTNNRRSGWTYDADGRVIGSADANTSSSRTWSYDAAGEETSVSETTGGATTTDSMAYDGDGRLVFESVTSTGTVSNYNIHSTVLGGAVLTKLNTTGGKSATYVPAKGLVAPMQQTDGNNNPSISWVHRDPLGVQESYGAAYDPLGNLINNEQPPTSGPPPTGPFYGPSYSGVGWSSFSNANNFSSGCRLDGAQASCDSVLRAIANGQVGRVVFSTSGGSADFANMGIFVMVSPVNQEASNQPPTLKSSMAQNPDPGNQDPYGVGQDELQWNVSILIRFDFSGSDPQDPEQGRNRGVRTNAPTDECAAHRTQLMGRDRSALAGC